MIRIEKKQAVPIGDILKDFIKSNHLTRGINIQKIFDAWDTVSGARDFTIRKFFRDGRLYITVNSSVVRSQLYYQKDLLIEKMNARLSQDRLFSPEDESTGHIRELILK